MSAAARSIQIFSIYLFALAAILLIAPNILLEFVGIPATSEVWIRVVGMLVGYLGFYYWKASLAEFTGFFAWTVPARLTILLFFLAFVLLELAPPALLIFAAIDAAAALWTLNCLRKR